MQNDEFLVNENATLVDALKVLDMTGRGCIFVVDDEKRLVGSVTDGDVRRYIIANGTPSGFVSEAASNRPIALHITERVKTDDVFEKYGIVAIPILDAGERVVDIVFNEPTRRKKRKPLIESIPVVIMAGGVGSRLMPLTSVIPKPLVPVNGIPIAEHIISRFCESGCNDFYFVLNYKKRMIKAYFDDCQKSYSVTYLEEEDYLGTGGGVKLVEPHIRSPFFLTNCDVLVDVDLNNLLEAHRNSDNAITVVCSLKNYIIPYGTIEISEGGQITKMTEKPSISSLVNTGCYLVEPSVFSFIENEESIGFPDVVMRCQSAGLKVGVYPISEGAWLDMGKPEELKHMAAVLGSEQELDIVCSTNSLQVE